MTFYAEWLSPTDTNYNKTFIVYYGAVILGGDNQSMMHLGSSLHILLTQTGLGDYLSTLKSILDF